MSYRTAIFFILARPDGEVVAVLVNGPAIGNDTAAKLLRQSLQRSKDSGLWQADSDIYLVVSRPIVAGSGAESVTLGFLAIGKRIDDSFAKQLGSFAGSEVLLTAGKVAVASTQQFSPARTRVRFSTTPVKTAMCSWTTVITRSRASAFRPALRYRSAAICCSL